MCPISNSARNKKTADKKLLLKIKVLYVIIYQRQIHITVKLQILKFCKILNFTNLLEFLCKLINIMTVCNWENLLKANEKNVEPKFEDLQV